MNPSLSAAKRESQKRRPSAADVAAASGAAPVMLDPEDLIADVVGASEQTLRIPDPDEATRAGYRRALAAISASLVPTGKRVTHTGRDHGDLVIRLVDLPAPVPSDPVVTVPSVLDPEHPLVGWLASNVDQMDIAEGSRERALRIVQAVAATLGQRGHSVSQPARTGQPGELEDAPVGGRSNGRRERPTTPPGPPTLEVTIGDQILEVDIYEELEKATTVPPQEAAKLKYDWQRATPVETLQFNGRLALRIRGYAPHQGWADRKRWTLESRLPKLITALEDVARARAEAIRQAREARQRRRREWEEALPIARAAYLAQLNRGRLEKQVDLHARAQQLRGYADAVAERAPELAEQERISAEAWAVWVRAEADRHDPTLKDGALAFVEPADIPHWELDKYMPRGYTASHPPN